MLLCIFLSIFSLTESYLQFSKETDRYIEEKKLKVVLVSMTKPQVEQHINGVSHAKETVGVPVTEETLDNVKEVPVVMNEVSDPLKARFSPLRGKPATVS